MGYFKHTPSGNHDCAELSTMELALRVEDYKSRLAELKKEPWAKSSRKLVTEWMRKYDYELRRRPDYKEVIQHLDRSRDRSTSDHSQQQC